MKDDTLKEINKNPIINITLNGFATHYFQFGNLNYKFNHKLSLIFDFFY